MGGSEDSLSIVGNRPAKSLNVRGNLMEEQQIWPTCGHIFEHFEW